MRKENRLRVRFGKKNVKRQYTGVEIFRSKLRLEKRLKMF